MITGQLAGLRARHSDDVAILHAELYDDVPGHARADSRPWRPLDAGHSPYGTEEPSAQKAVFSVVDLASGELAGEALLWGIDLHNRGAHLGMSLRPDFRGRGLGAETVRLLCAYGFTVRGLHRLQLETLADNPAMIGAGRRAGFRVEGTLSRSAWVYGAFVDEVIMGLTAEEWQGEAAGRT
ncbi:GNAT family N-acetyltransferase [Streptomyces sp. NPDC101733]|uniref:GNAT family N-acetyltransferase n=1 Tax=unclassified Streptomyces TaxID=2593676 RepID=UPI0037FA6130